MSSHTASDPGGPASVGEPLIRIEDVSVRYRMPREKIASFKDYAIRWLKRDIDYEDLWALRSVSMEVRRGEVFGIIGPNGAGKSTLLKLIARVLRPTSGRVRVKGRVAPLLELGAGFDFELTARENIFLNGAILGYSRADVASRFDRIVEFAGLREFIDMPLRNFSSGMVARLGFAVATDVPADILIVDEILGVGDADFQTRSRERMDRLRQEGEVVLLCSHALKTIVDSCQRAAWLDHGRLMAIGPAAEVVYRYQLTFVPELKAAAATKAAAAAIE
jgi:ABC-2 type transport system ATP-binding protein/lipopolysaccharide transport system ATP-binding protein